MSSDQKIRGEESLIREFLAPLAAGDAGAFGLEDDCAAFAPSPGHDLIVKTDPVAEGVHFLPEDQPSDIAWKALAVNVSDLAAKAAVPRAYLMALSFPEAPSRSWMQCFADGLATAQGAFGLRLIGGDTDRRPGPVTVSITVLGETPAGGMVRRGTARAGDAIYVSGALGEAALGLRLRRDPALAGVLGLTAAAAAAAIERYLRPAPRLALREALRGHASAAMDISDGFLKDLGRMCRASRCAAVVGRDALPLGAAVRQAIDADPARCGRLWTAGDDYEVLAAVPVPAVPEFESAAAAAGVVVTRVGSTAAGSGHMLLAPDGSPISIAPDEAGWEHF